MKPKYTERLTQGLAIGAAALALSGCNDPVKTAKRTVHNVEVAVKSAIDIRLKLDACIKEVHPERDFNPWSIWKSSSSKHPIFSRKFYNPLRLDCSPSALHVMPKTFIRTCPMAIETKSFVCVDDNANGTWEEVFEMPTENTLLEPFDKFDAPAKWSYYQDKCNSAFSECLD